MDKVKSLKVQGFEGIDNKRMWIKVMMEDGRKFKVEVNQKDTLEEIVAYIVRKIENEH